MITRSNEVYTPLEVDGVDNNESGIISGGFGDDTTVTRGVRFLWVYDPTNSLDSPSGFTGHGWFENNTNTPIGYYIQKNGVTLNDIISRFNNGKDNLNDVFLNWQNHVNTIYEQSKIDLVQQFQYLVDDKGRGCWQNQY